MDASSIQEFCTNRKETTVTPFSHGKADTGMCLGTIGPPCPRPWLCLGEHNIFMEMAYPMIYNLLVPREKVLEMPICNTSDCSLFSYKQERKPRDLPCPVIHPIKFGKEKWIVLWKEIVDKRSRCEWQNENQTYWEIVDWRILASNLLPCYYVYESMHYALSSIKNIK